MIKYYFSIPFPVEEEKNIGVNSSEIPHIVINGEIANGEITYRSGQKGKAPIHEALGLIN